MSDIPEDRLESASFAQVEQMRKALENPYYPWDRPGWLCKMQLRLENGPFWRISSSISSLRFWLWKVIR